MTFDRVCLDWDSGCKVCVILSDNLVCSKTRHYQWFTHQFPASARVSLLILWPLFFYTQTPWWAMLTSRTLIWRWFLCCEYDYTQLKPNCRIRLIELSKYAFSHVTKTDASATSAHHLKSAKKKKEGCDFHWFFFFTFIFCEILVSDSCLETGVVSQWVYAQLRGVNQVLAERRLARINPELWVVTERMRSQTQAAQMSFQVLLN